MTNYLEYDRAGFSQQIGNLIRSHRKLRGISMTDLAQHLDVSFQQIQKYENGTNQVSLYRLFSIANYFGISLQEFLNLNTGLTPMKLVDKFSLYVQFTENNPPEIVDCVNHLLKALVTNPHHTTSIVNNLAKGTIP